MELNVDGNTVFCATGGQDFDPALPTTMFIHGASFDRTVWKLQARYFAWHGSNVLAVDLPGHGRSAGAPLESIEAMADWLTRVLDAAGVDKAALVGHSMGGQVALDCAGRHGARVRALALLGGALSIPVNSALLDPAQADDHLAFDLLNVWGYGRRAQLGVHRMPGLWMMKGGLRIMERAAKGLLFTDLSATNAYDGGAAAAAVACPTLVVIGEMDLMTPAKAGRALADTIAGAASVTLPGLGHIMLEEDPDATLDALRDFLMPLQA
ncbi:MAG: alpha/beta hydrolase [Alphaproteobacteria bacterium]|jgi:pimeloyl-ACP methyl ester carboxylesterase|nr:alpha/beta hydrolase [Alphaproteobacteria bacterium]MDP6588471.1 alpha/beta hydrolase [Alphaproteobacteria bacterium]MDP6817838.1 alpha/beta hydrolase [Alphaproteobacteria bacterium]